MELTAVVSSFFSGFDIQWGDTLRIRDLYTPYYHLSVEPVKPFHRQYPRLKQILLYSFTEYPADVHDQFDEQKCLHNAKFHDLHVGSLVSIKGSCYAILTTNNSERFGKYRFAIIKPEAHTRKYDINGFLEADITEWFIEKTAIEDPSCLAETVQLVVGWECCSITANSPS